MLHNTLHKLLNDPDTAFVVVGAAITIFIMLLRWLPGYCKLLWKSTLVSYIIFIIFMLLEPIHYHSLLETPLFNIPYHILGATLMIPGMLIQGLIFGVGPCPIGDNAEFYILIFAFLFYAVVIWGIMKLIKKSKEPITVETKQDNEVEKQTPTETNL
jgi:hypothetical protein